MSVEPAESLEDRHGVDEHSEVDAARPLLTGRPTRVTLFAAVLTGAFVWVCVGLFARGGFGTLRGSWGDQLFLSYIGGGAVGYMFACTRCRVEVYADRVVSVNALRVDHVARPAIAAIGIVSGVCFYLVNLHALWPATFYAAPLKRWTGNRRDIRFGTAMAEALGVPTEISGLAKRPLAPGLVTRRLRRDVPIFIVAGLCLTVLYGVVMRIA